ncbi:SGNH hydrolase-type esterase domain-containing protein [Xylariomycetidae sp. FL2044]|nr:SGNH hydrolase-type esterase domain-containing protein [Xylariomycetidae sp. FL2044]
MATATASASAEHWYFISGVEAWLPRAASRSVAVVGDSITDGRGSTTNGNDRWTDVLAARLLLRSSSHPSSSSSSSCSSSSAPAPPPAPPPAIGVINQAAGGNRVLNDGLGPNALSRIERDVVAQPGVGYAMVFEGVNDIGTAAAADAAAQEEVGARLIAAYDQVVARLHRFGIPVFGCTITPFSGPGQTYSDPERERTRQRVNAWIRSSGRFDGVVDFDAVVRNETQVDQLRAEFDSGDYLHLNPAGYAAMGEAVDLTLFDRFADGVESMV